MCLKDPALLDSYIFGCMCFFMHCCFNGWTVCSATAWTMRLDAEPSASVLWWGRAAAQEPVSIVPCILADHSSLPPSCWWLTAALSHSDGWQQLQDSYNQSCYSFCVFIQKAHICCHGYTSCLGGVCTSLHANPITVFIMFGLITIEPDIARLCCVIVWVQFSYYIVCLSFLL